MRNRQKKKKIKVFIIWYLSEQNKTKINLKNSMWNLKKFKALKWNKK